jgi:3-oxoadipate enol-lactonase
MADTGNTGNVTTGYADVNGAKLYYEVAGAGHPLVFAHAGIANLQMWDDQFSVFADRYRVARYDHRSFGQSNAPAGPASISDDIYGMLNFLNIDKTYLVGCSMGGGAALDFTLAHPEMVDGLVLVGPGVSGMPDDFEDPLKATWEEIQAAAKAGDFDKANELELRVWVDGIDRTPDQVDPAYRAKASAMNRALYDHDAEMRAIDWQEADPPAYPRLGTITAPTLLIVGDRDVPDIQHAVDVLAERIPGAKKVVMHDTAHLPSMELPQQFNQILSDFLSNLG